MKRLGLSLPWVVLGPNSVGRDYDVLALSPTLKLSRGERERLETYTLASTAAATRAAPVFASLFPLEDGPAARWLLARTGYLREADLGPMIVTWALVLDLEALDALDWAPHRLLDRFPWEAPSTPPEPLTLDRAPPPSAVPEQLARPARILAADASASALAVSVAEPWAAQDLAVAVVEAVAPRIRRAAWTTTAALGRAGRFDPSTLFRWVFAPAAARPAQAFPAHVARSFGPAGLAGEVEIPAAQRTWAWLHMGAYNASGHGEASRKIDAVLGAFKDGVQASDDPAGAVALVIRTAVQAATLAEAGDLFELLAGAVNQIPAELTTERFIGSHAVLAAFEDYFGQVDVGLRPDLLDLYLDRLAPAVPHAPASQPIRLLLSDGLLAKVDTRIIERFAGDLVQAKAAPITADYLPKLSAPALNAIGRGVVQAIEGADDAEPTWRLADRVAAQLAPRGSGADPALFEHLLNRLIAARRGSLARLLRPSAGLEGRLGRQGLRSALGPLIDWVRRDRFTADSDSVDAFERNLVLACAAVAALETAAA